MELSGSSIKKIYIFWETEAPKKIPYICGNGNPKKLLYFRKLKYQAQTRKIEIHPEKSSSDFGNETV